MMHDRGDEGGLVSQHLLPTNGVGAIVLTNPSTTFATKTISMSTSFQSLPPCRASAAVEQRPGGEDQGSSDSNSLSHYSTAQPQHKAASDSDQPASVFTEATSAASTESGMCNRKRSSADLTASSTAASATTDAQASSIKPPQPHKKRRVSFCKTTKPPSEDLQKLRPPNSLHQLQLSMNHSVSCTALPHLASSTSSDLASDGAPSVELDLNVSPSQFVKNLVHQSKSLTGAMKGEDVIAHATRRVNHPSYFLTYTPDHLEAYTVDKVNAVQTADVDGLRLLWKEGHEMQSSNRFGESLLHTSCRRGFADVVTFFIHEAGVSPRVRDDMGRTPMHDACWASCPPNHDIMRTLIVAAPELLLSKDKRGHSPFDYARREYWPQWVSFLNEHRGLVVESLVASCVEGDMDRLEFGEGEVNGVVNQ